jgi:hypothetical protein
MHAIYCAAVPEAALKSARPSSRFLPDDSRARPLPRHKKLANYGVETGLATAVAAPGAGTIATTHQRGRPGRMRLSSAVGISRGLPVAAVLRTGARRQIPPCAPKAHSGFSLAAACCTRYASFSLSLGSAWPLPQPGYPSACSWAVNRVPAVASESTLATLPVSSHGQFTPSSSSSWPLFCPSLRLRPVSLRAAAMAVGRPSNPSRCQANLISALRDE